MPLLAAVALDLREWVNSRLMTFFFRCTVASEDNSGWSPYGAPWLQPVAVKWQINWVQKWLKQAKSVATSCRRLPEKFHGKECHEEGPPQ
jgi:hypothetical protein